MMPTTSSFNTFHLAPAPKSRVSSTSREPDTPDMLLWSRLPTPAPHDLLSPPPSGASSPRSFNGFTPSSSKFSLPSPLPSPIEPSSSSSKTAAFFASPFSASSSTMPLPPPPPPKPTKSSTLVFLENAETPKPDVRPSIRSATADFFATPFNASSSRPTPPPSLKSSASSREPSPPPRLPPLSRVFPSRFASDPTKVEGFDREASSNSQDDSYASRPDSSSWETSFKREFINLSEKDLDLELANGATHNHSLLSTSPVTEHFAHRHPPLASSRSHEHFSYQDAQSRPGMMGKDGAGSSTDFPSSKDRAPIAARLPPQQAHPIRRETHKVPLTIAGDHPSLLHDTDESEVCPGAILRNSNAEPGEEVELCLVRSLGEGAFSSVWLAEDIHGTFANDATSRSYREEISRSANASPTRERKLGQRRKSESLAKGRSLRRMPGLRPVPSPLKRPLSYLHGDDHVRRNGSENDDDASSVGETSTEGSVLLDEWDGEGALSSFVDESTEMKCGGRLVAVKMMHRALCDVNDRTRISFVREVEVLRHISHPSIVSYIHSFTTSAYHCLVLEHVGGGELFSLVNSNEQYAKVSEPAIRRMWGELCRAVGWMHGVGLVHRDIKLENILLTSNIFSTPNAVAILPPLNVPLIKLTDFGLSRFIDMSSPLLSTRCGSESYAAPELVMGSSRSKSNGTDVNGGKVPKKGYYDGRETDAWACGVVLYALATRVLPFDVPPPGSVGSRPGSIKGSIGRSAGRAVAAKSSKRREMLIRIAQCEYAWPDEMMVDEDDVLVDEQGAVVPMVGGVSEGVKSVVRRLLVRDPARRARLVELWDEEVWMRGEGAPVPPVCSSHAQQPQAGGAATSPAGKSEDASYFGEGTNGFVSAQDGILVDEDHIDRVALEEEDEP